MRSEEEVERLTKICLNKYRASLLTAYPAMEGAVRAVLSELPEPTAPDWATPEAKAVLDWFADYGGLGSVAQIQAYRASLKPKTVELPETWVVYIKNGHGKWIVHTWVDSERRAKSFEENQGGECKWVHIPSQTVPAEGK